VFLALTDLSNRPTPKFAEWLTSLRFASSVNMSCIWITPSIGLDGIMSAQFRNADANAMPWQIDRERSINGEE
jgi:hypothetical protein